jgi:2-polyprenyl-3-methyl-5-hydroxy-6-metoxy-1,4-benzoquinol methylase
MQSVTPTDAFTQKMVQTMNAGATAMMISIGHRTGLFDKMADLPASTTDVIAGYAGLSERYVREWLGAMVTAQVVHFNAAENTYRLPPEHAASLTRAASPNNLAATCQWISLLGSVESRVVEAFTHGRGVPYAAYDRFHEVMAEESAQSVVAGLTDHILPLVPGLVDALHRGIDVLDVGCGAGRAMNTLARMFPNSHFTGYDLSPDAIRTARADAAAAQLDNVDFEVCDVATLEDARGFDLITAFDAIHDQARPEAVLANIARNLRRGGGVFLMQDILASSHVQKNMDHPLAPFIYTVSCMHCMSVSLANGGPGLGAAWGKEKALQMLDDAGFSNVEVSTLPHDPMNYYYIARCN